MAKIATAPKSNSVIAKKSDSNRISQEAIAKLAYQFYIERGYEHGHDREDWARAEAIIKSRQSS